MSPLNISLASFVVVVFVVVVCTSTSASAAKLLSRLHQRDDCSLVAAPCNTAYYNQTFSTHKTAVESLVRIRCDWVDFEEPFSACILNKDTTPVTFSRDCSGDATHWTPSSAAAPNQYVSYRNSQNLCLTRAATAMPNSAPFTYQVELQPCCVGAAACPRETQLRQMWLERAAPYWTISNQLLEHGASKSGMICLSRVSGSC